MPLVHSVALVFGALWLALAVTVTTAGNSQESAPPTGVAATHIDVFKPDGSRQCEPDSGEAIAAMREQLVAAGVDVRAARTTTDGMHRAQVCGAPTGRIHVFTIDAAAAETAADLGFLPGAAVGLQPPPQASSER